LWPVNASVLSVATDSANLRFLKVILQELPAASGAVEIGARTQINYVDQNRLLLDDDKNGLGRSRERRRTRHPRRGEHHVARLSAADFFSANDRINTKISQLSGGERRRVLLAKILKRGGNVLNAREPTNDLDLGNVTLARGSARRLRRCVIRGEP